MVVLSEPLSSALSETLKSKKSEKTRKKGVTGSTDLAVGSLQREEAEIRLLSLRWLRTYLEVPDLGLAARRVRVLVELVTRQVFRVGRHRSDVGGAVL